MEVPVKIIRFSAEGAVWLNVAGGVNVDNVKAAESFHVTEAH